MSSRIRRSAVAALGRSRDQTPQIAGDSDDAEESMDLFDRCGRLRRSVEREYVSTYKKLPKPIRPYSSKDIEVLKRILQIAFELCHQRGAQEPNALDLLNALDTLPAEIRSHENYYFRLVLKLCIRKEPTWESKMVALSKNICRSELAFRFSRWRITSRHFARWGSRCPHLVYYSPTFSFRTLHRTVDSAGGGADESISTIHSSPSRVRAGETLYDADRILDVLDDVEELWPTRDSHPEKEITKPRRVGGGYIIPDASRRTAAPSRSESYVEKRDASGDREILTALGDDSIPFDVFRSSNLHPAATTQDDSHLHHSTRLYYSPNDTFTADLQQHSRSTAPPAAASGPQQQRAIPASNTTRNSTHLRWTDLQDTEHFADDDDSLLHHGDNSTARENLNRESEYGVVINSGDGMAGAGGRTSDREREREATARSEFRSGEGERDTSIGSSSDGVGAYGDFCLLRRTFRLWQRFAKHQRLLQLATEMAVFQYRLAVSFHQRLLLKRGFEGLRWRGKRAAAYVRISGLRRAWSAWRRYGECLALGGEKVKRVGEMYVARRVFGEWKREREIREWLKTQSRWYFSLLSPVLRRWRDFARENSEKRVAIQNLRLRMDEYTLSRTFAEWRLVSLSLRRERHRISEVRRRHLSLSLSRSAFSLWYRRAMHSSLSRRFLRFRLSLSLRRWEAKMYRNLRRERFVSGLRMAIERRDRESCFTLWRERYNERRRVFGIGAYVYKQRLYSLLARDFWKWHSLAIREREFRHLSQSLSLSLSRRRLQSLFSLWKKRSADRAMSLSLSLLRFDLQTRRRLWLQRWRNVYLSRVRDRERTEVIEATVHRRVRRDVYCRWVTRVYTHIRRRRLLANTIARMQRFTIAKVFTSWRTYIATRRHRKCILHSAYVHWSGKSVRVCMDGWRKYVQLQREEREKSSEIRERERLSVQRRAIERWTESLHVRRRAKLLVKMCVYRFSESRVWSLWRRWRDFVRIEKRCRKLQEMIAFHHSHHLAAHFLDVWKSNFDSSKKYNSVRRHFERKIDLRSLRSVWIRWKQSSIFTYRLQKKELLLRPFFNSWKMKTSSLLYRREKLKKVIVFWQNKEMLSRFLRWKKFVEDKNAAKFVYEKALKIWRNANSARAFNAWKSYVNDIKQRRELLTDVIQRWKLGIVHSSFQIWHRYTFLHRRRVHLDRLRAFKFSTTSSMRRLWRKWREMYKQRWYITTSEKMWREKGEMWAYKKWKERYVQRRKDKMLLYNVYYTLRDSMLKRYMQKWALKRKAKVRSRFLRRRARMHYETSLLSVALSRFRAYIHARRSRRRFDLSLLAQWQRHSDELSVALAFSTWKSAYALESDLRERSNALSQQKVSAILHAWRLKARQRRHERLALIFANRQRARQVIHRWYHYTRRVRRFSGTVVRALRHSFTRRMFSVWKDQWRSRRAQRVRVVGALSHWRRSVEGRALSQWWNWVQILRKRRLDDSRKLWMWQERRMARVLARWSGRTEWKLRLKRALIHWRDGSAGGAFRRWREWVWERKKLRGCMAIALTNWHRIIEVKALNKLRQYAHSRKQKRFADYYRRRRVLISGMKEWMNACRESVYWRRQVYYANRHYEISITRSALHAWIIYRKECRLQRIQEYRADEHYQTHLLSRHLSGWQRYIAARRRSHHLSLTLSESHTLNTLHHHFTHWYQSTHTVQIRRRALSAWRNYSLHAALNAWHTYTLTQKRLRHMTYCALVRGVQYFWDKWRVYVAEERERRLSWERVRVTRQRAIFSRWVGKAAEQIQRRVAERHWAGRVLGGVVKEWFTVTQRSIRTRRLMQRVLGNRMLSTFDRWKAFVVHRKNCAEAFVTISQWRKRDSMEYTWERWRWMYGDRMRVYDLQDRIFRQWSNWALAKSFRNWIEYIRHKVRARRNIQISRYRYIQRRFLAWRNLARIMGREGERREKVERRIRLRKEREVWQKWTKGAESLRSRKRILSKWKSIHLHRAFNEWREWVHRRRVCMSTLLSVYLRWRNSYLSSAWGSWIEYTRKCRALRKQVTRAVTHKLDKRFRRWREYTHTQKMWRHARLRVESMERERLKEEFFGRWWREYCCKRAAMVVQRSITPRYQTLHAFRQWQSEYHYVHRLRHLSHRRTLSKYFSAFRQFSDAFGSLRRSSEKISHRAKASMLQSFLLKWIRKTIVTRRLRRIYEEIHGKYQIRVQKIAVESWKEWAKKSVEKKTRLRTLKAQLNFGTLSRTFGEWQKWSKKSAYRRQSGEKVSNLVSRNVLRFYLSEWQGEMYKEIDYRREQIQSTLADIHYHRVAMEKTISGWRQFVHRRRRERERLAMARKVYRRSLCRSVLFGWKKSTDGLRRDRQVRLALHSLLRRITRRRYLRAWHSHTQSLVYRRNLLLRERQELRKSVLVTEHKSRRLIGETWKRWIEAYRWRREIERVSRTAALRRATERWRNWARESHRLRQLVRHANLRKAFGGWRLAVQTVTMGREVGEMYTRRREMEVWRRWRIAAAVRVMNADSRVRRFVDIMRRWKAWAAREREIREWVEIREERETANVFDRWREHKDRSEKQCAAVDFATTHSVRTAFNAWRANITDALESRTRHISERISKRVMRSSLRKWRASFRGAQYASRRYEFGLFSRRADSTSLCRFSARSWAVVRAWWQWKQCVHESVRTRLAVWTYRKRLCRTAFEYWRIYVCTASTALALSPPRLPSGSSTSTALDDVILTVERPFRSRSSGAVTSSSSVAELQLPLAHFRAPSISVSPSLSLSPSPTRRRGGESFFSEDGEWREREGERELNVSAVSLGHSTQSLLSLRSDRSNVSSSLRATHPLPHHSPPPIPGEREREGEKGKGRLQSAASYALLETQLRQSLQAQDRSVRRMLKREVPVVVRREREREGERERAEMLLRKSMMRHIEDEEDERESPPKNTDRSTDPPRILIPGSSSVSLSIAVSPSRRRERERASSIRSKEGRDSTALDMDDLV